MKNDLKNGTALDMQRSFKRRTEKGFAKIL